VARFKNVSGGAREVPLLAELGLPGIVEADEIVEVPDEVAAGYVWPEETWQTTKASAKTRTAGTATEVETGKGE
jgi:hypothetical protein